MKPVFVELSKIYEAPTGQDHKAIGETTKLKYEVGCNIPMPTPQKKGRQDTVVRISYKTKQKIEESKIHPRETIDQCLWRIIENNKKNQ